MQAEQPLPAPDTSGGGPANPYDFLYQKPPKSGGVGSLLPSGNSTKQRILIVVGGAILLLIIFVVIFSLIFGGKGGSVAGVTKVAQQQQELVRVANKISDTSQSPDTRTFSENILYSTTTDQLTLQKYFTTHNIKISSTVLAEGKNSQTDATLSNAQQIGDYDDVAVSTLENLEKNYQQLLSTTYKTATPTQKGLLSQFYTHTVALLKNTPSVQPDTNS